jgi:hypothetical protein
MLLGAGDEMGVVAPGARPNLSFSFEAPEAKAQSAFAPDPGALGHGIRGSLEARRAAT